MRFRPWSLVALASALVAAAAILAAGPPSPHPALTLAHNANGLNSPAAQKAHYVVLVSLDGFRYDYAERGNAAHLLALGKHGVWAPQGIYPSYPSVTFPNHMALVTGLSPGHHGIVANSFFDPVRQAGYSSSDPQAVNDGGWYSGVPLWSLAESQGMRTAALFWPGSEAKIAGYQPTWYAQAAAATEATPAMPQARIDSTVALLKLPAEERPHFIAIYYSEPDSEGHKFGPDAAETRAAVLKMDALIGKLKSALDSTGLPIDLVVVSDHGMTPVEGPWVTLDQFADLSNFKTVGALLYSNSEPDRVRAYNQLKKASTQFVVYRLKDAPAALGLYRNARFGDPVVVATGPYAIRAHAPAAGQPDPPPSLGMHGLDPHRFPQMRASFFAAGPDIVPGKTVAPFDNVNLYPWLAHMLSLQAPKSDGSLNILAGTLRDNGQENNVDSQSQGASEK